MPNVETNNKNNAPSSQKSKKEKRKSLAVTTEKDVSPLRQETLSPITPAVESVDSSLENVNKNPYIDVINKRIKKLKKMMQKIEKYETIKNSTGPDEVQLNADQIKVLERKGEVSGAIKEFEETLKQIETVEKDELKKQDEQKKAQQAERDQAIADAVEANKAVHCKSLLQLILFFRLVHFNQRGIIQLSDIEFEAVETLRAKLTTLSEEAENNELYDEKIYQVLDHVNKLRSGDESPITKSLPNGIHETDEEPSGISYSQLRSLVQNPPILESSGEQEELQETFENVPTSEMPELIENSSNVTTEFAIQASGLQFMLHSDDQPQSQAFDTTTVNNTTYGYQSTDAEQIPVAVSETAVDHNVQEQYNQQQQNYDKYSVEQQQQFAEQYIGEQQHFVEQSDQQEVEQEELSQQQEEPLSVQEPQTTLEDQADSKQPQATQQNDNQPPPQGSGHRGYRGNRGNRGYRGGHGSRRDSGGYNRDGNYGGGYYRGRGSSGPRGGRGGFQGGNRGTQYRPRAQ